MKKYLIFPLIIAFGAVLTSCGTVSGVNTAGAEVAASESGYSKVIVRDFTHTVPDIKVKYKVETATKALPDYIASEIGQTGKFSQVSRSGSPDSSTLIVDGVITEYDDGNAALKMLVGFAAGNSNLNGNITFRDGGTGKTVGSIKADKNSWALGGALAASQTADSFFEPVAKKVAKEAEDKFSRTSVAP